ncbi:MAG TPA: hypothetical protein VN924_14610 [Bryobacteraceae bacterium]|nr:hypothetical protein [Bryobacteraceae bacterium]
MKNLAPLAGILAITALTWFQLPGHTWLQQDTQIYVPILEHLRDPAVLGRDMLATRPHVSFTLYDETARALAHVTGLGFREVLEGLQIVTRMLGIWGLYLIASALGLSAPAAVLVAGIVSLGATIAGPAVLSFEIEPDPRGFAVPLLFLAIGLAAHGRDFASGIAGSAAFLMHPPAAIPFWGVYFVWAVARRRLLAFIPLTAACMVLAAAAFFQQGAHEAQLFFSRIPPAIENLQRLRAPYSYISEWWRDWLPHYLVLYAASVLAYMRLRKRASLDLQFFLVGLPLVGILSIPASYILLEKMKWVLLPQVQPMRALLFVTVIAQLSAAAAGIVAAQSRRYAEGFAWLALAYLVPLNTSVTVMPAWNGALAAALLAAGASFAAFAEARKFRWSAAALGGVAVAAFFLSTTLGAVRTYPHLHTPELAQLSAWARASTPADAVFLFADAGKQLQPGIFRSEGLRAVYVDWKGGGQVNYLIDLGQRWWTRWQQAMSAPFDQRSVARYGPLGIDYIVLSPRDRLPDRAPVFENTAYLVYAL